MLARMSLILIHRLPIASPPDPGARLILPVTLNNTRYCAFLLGLGSCGKPDSRTLFGAR
jgi:hypothetical protein